MRKCRGTPLFPVFSFPRASGQALSDIGENIDKCFVPRIIPFIIAYPIEKYKRLQAFDDTESLLFYCIIGAGGGFCFIVPQSPPKVNVFSADTRPPFFPPDKKGGAAFPKNRIPRAFFCEISGARYRRQIVGKSRVDRLCDALLKRLRHQQRLVLGIG